MLKPVLENTHTQKKELLSTWMNTDPSNEDLILSLESRQH